jgi:hypothetical protein
MNLQYFMTNGTKHSTSIPYSGKFKLLHYSRYTAIRSRNLTLIQLCFTSFSYIGSCQSPHCHLECNRSFDRLSLTSVWVCQIHFTRITSIARDQNPSLLLKLTTTILGVSHKHRI